MKNKKVSKKVNKKRVNKPVEKTAVEETVVEEAAKADDTSDENAQVNETTQVAEDPAVEESSDVDNATLADDGASDTLQDNLGKIADEQLAEANAMLDDIEADTTQGSDHVEVDLDPMLVTYEELANPVIMQNHESLTTMQMHFARYLKGILRPTNESTKRFNELLKRMHERQDIYTIMMLTRGVPELMAEGKLEDYWMGLLWILNELRDPNTARAVAKQVNLAGLLTNMPQPGFDFLQQYLERLSRF